MHRIGTAKGRQNQRHGLMPPPPPPPLAKGKKREVERERQVKKGTQGG